MLIMEQPPAYSVSNSFDSPLIDKNNLIYQKKSQINKKKIQFSNSTLFLAANASSDYEELLYLLNNNLVDINEGNIDGLTALHHACIDDNIKLVDFLLKHGADVNVVDNEGWSPLHVTASCGHFNIAKLLLFYGADCTLVNVDGELPIDLTDKISIRVLLEEKLKEQKGVLNLDVLRRQEEEMMIDDVNEMVKSGIYDEKINKKNNATILHVAACKGYLDVFQILFNNRLLKKQININAKDNDGWTPLAAAAYWNNPIIVELLLQNGANVNEVTNSNQTIEQLTQHELILDLLSKKREQIRKLQEIKIKDKENTSLNSSTTNLSTTESETQRKTNAKRARESRRSTQGISLEDVNKAKDQLFNHSQTVNANHENEKLNSKHYNHLESNNSSREENSWLIEEDQNYEALNGNERIKNVTIRRDSFAIKKPKASPKKNSFNQFTSENQLPETSFTIQRLNKTDSYDSETESSSFLDSKVKRDISQDSLENQFILNSKPNQSEYLNLESSYFNDNISIDEYNSELEHADETNTVINADSIYQNDDAFVNKIDNFSSQNSNELNVSLFKVPVVIETPCTPEPPVEIEENSTCFNVNLNENNLNEINQAKNENENCEDAQIFNIRKIKLTSRENLDYNCNPNFYSKNKKDDIDSAYNFSIPTTINQKNLSNFQNIETINVQNSVTNENNNSSSFNISMRSIPKLNVNLSTNLVTKPNDQKTNRLGIYTKQKSIEEEFHIKLPSNTSRSRQQTFSNSTSSSDKLENCKKINNQFQTNEATDGNLSESLKNNSETFNSKYMKQKNTENTSQTSFKKDATTPKELLNENNGSNHSKEYVLPPVLNSTNGELNYKKMYNDLLIEFENYKSEVTKKEQELLREKRQMQRKLSELEEELAQMETIKEDNSRLKNENGALVRVISKLSK